ncbi:MAG: N-6 DNA methylase [Thermoanaerobaculia bacterium]|nr:N-6 DNA methylase [Thermoanaerobaculia bacterium]
MANNDILSRFDMEPGKGLVWVSKPTSDVSDAEVLALAEARKFKADAVYFRRIENENRSVPQVYIYEGDFSDKDLVETHRNLWSSGVVPFFYVITPSEFKIFNCTKAVEISRNGLTVRPLDKFRLADAIERQRVCEKFSAKLFDNGSFWEEHPEILNVANSPYQKLLESLLKAKKKLERRQPTLNPTTINKLLIIGLLVRYLEEKKDEEGRAMGQGLYEKFEGCSRFTDILRTNQIIAFLTELDRKFNGKLFDLKDAEKKELANTNLDFAAAIFDANLDAHTEQFVLWDLYAFNHLPIELISGIYEAFLKKEDSDSKKNRGVVYTPPFLVNALIDECMPLDKAEELFKKEDFKVFDPACGSGIFLVAALKRMVQWWAINRYKTTGRIEYPDILTIQRITKNNIFGADIEEGATLISIFSLCIALCDKLSPMQIWNELRFEDLSENNIHTADFFKIYNQFQKGHFDLLIGNPPFNPPAPFNNKSYLKHVKDNYKVEPSHPLNDDNLALFFWDRAVHLRKPGGIICFILPSGAWLYNNNSLEYRRHFLQQFQVGKIIDFTHLSDRLFHRSTNVAVCATIATDRTETLPADLLHIVVRRSKVAEERFHFELDHYDFHRVSYKTALESPFVWKANLLGGGRLLRLVNYLGNLRSLGEYLEEKKGERWVWAEGYIIGKGDKPAEWITGKNTVDTESFTERGIGKIKIEDATLFYRNAGENKEIFKPPHILIKENLGQDCIPIVFSEEYLCFKHEIIGIHAKQEDSQTLKKLYQNLTKNAKTNRFFLISASTRAGVSRSTSTLLKNDIMGLPYPENPDDLRLGYSETIVQNDVLEYYIKSNASSENSPLSQPVSRTKLEEYGEVFCNILNPIYEQNGQKWFVQSFYEGDAAIAFAFCYGMPRIDVLPNLFEGGLQNIENMIQNKTHRNIRIHRVLREYLHLDDYDVLLLIKPKSLRYWLKSIALRDADETFNDLKRTGF